MTEKEIQELLEQYADCRFADDAIALQKSEMRQKAMTEIENARKSIIETLPHELLNAWHELNEKQARLDLDIDAEFASKSDDAKLNMQILEGKIREAVLAAGASIKGKRFTCQWVKPSIKMTVKGLELAHKKYGDALYDFCEKSEPSTRIVANKS